MKCEIEPIAECAFSPVVIKLTLENKEELQELWHRFYVCTLNLKRISYINHKGSRVFDFDENTNRFYGIWSDIDNIMEQRGIEA